MALFLGDWNESRAAITELEQRDLSLTQIAVLDCVRLMLMALSGQPAEASTRLNESANQLATSEDVALPATYLRARAVVNLAAGDFEAAQRESAKAVSTSPMGINSPHALAIQARAALWLGDTEGVREALAAMMGFRGRWMEAERLTAKAGLAALEGRGKEAAKGYQEAIEAWRTLECTLDLALCELDLVLLLGADHRAATVVMEARDIFAQLGAKPFLDRLNWAAGIAQVN